MRHRLFTILLCCSALFFIERRASGQAAVVYDPTADLNAHLQFSRQTSQWARDLENSLEQIYILRDMFSQSEKNETGRKIARDAFMGVYFWGNFTSTIITTIQSSINAVQWTIQSFDNADKYYADNPVGKTSYIVSATTSIVRQADALINTYLYLASSAIYHLSDSEIMEQIEKLYNQAHKISMDTSNLQNNNIDDARAKDKAAQNQKLTDELRSNAKQGQPSTSGVSSRTLAISTPLLLYRFIPSCQTFRGRNKNGSSLQRSIQDNVNKAKRDRESIERNPVGSIKAMSPGAFHLIQLILGFSFIILLVSAFRTYLKGEERHWDIWLKYGAALLVVVISFTIITAIYNNTAAGI